MANSFAGRAACAVIGGLGIALALVVLPLEVLIPLVLLAVVVGLTAVVGHASTIAGDQRERRITSWSQPCDLGVSAISTAELCRQWHQSFEDLHQAITPAARLSIVTARQRCLDELERRDPDGLHAWLSSSASAAGDPSRFLRTNQPEGPT